MQVIWRVLIHQENSPDFRRGQREAGGGADGESLPLWPGGEMVRLISDRGDQPFLTYLSF